MFLSDLFTSPSFANVWYWIMTALTWSAACHWIVGTPFDIVMRAEREGEPFDRMCDEIARGNALRLATLFREGGLVITGASAFMIAALATVGIWFRAEWALAALMLATPLMLVSALSVRLALRIERDHLIGAALRKALSRRRFWNQVIGLLAIMAAAAAAVLNNLDWT